MNKKIINIFLIFVLIFTLSVPAFSWSSDDAYSNVSSLDILNNAPVLFEGAHGVLYQSSTEKYFAFGGYEGYSMGAYYKVDSTSGALQIYNWQGGKFEVREWNGTEWINQTVYSTWNMDGLTYVNCSINFFVDDSLLEWDGYTLKFNGEIINPPTDDGEDDIEHGGSSGSRDENDDMSDSGFLQGIKDFFTGLFEGIIDLVEFIGDFIMMLYDFANHLWESMQKIPEFVDNLDVVFSPDGDLMTTFKSMMPDNQYANAIISMMLLFLGYTMYCIVMWFVKKFMMKD